jgi:hypothetical protein
VASYVVGANIPGGARQDWFRAVLSSGLWVLIFSAAILDVFYYNRLLQGAVAGLPEFERQHPEIQMSTRIDATVGYGWLAVWIAYGSMLVSLAGFVLWGWMQYVRGRQVHK